MGVCVNRIGTDYPKLWSKFTLLFDGESCDQQANVCNAGDVEFLASVIYESNDFRWLMKKYDLESAHFTEAEWLDVAKRVITTYLERKGYSVR